MVQFSSPVFYVLFVAVITTRWSRICGFKLRAHCSLRIKRDCFFDQADHFPLCTNNWGIKKNLVENIYIYILKRPLKTLHLCSFYFVDKKPTEENIYPAVRCCCQTTRKETPDYKDDWQQCWQKTKLIKYSRFVQL